MISSVVCCQVYLPLRRWIYDCQNYVEKTNRINLLFDFYEPLLTDKQQNIP